MHVHFGESFHIEKFHRKAENGCVFYPCVVGSRYI